MPRPSIGAFLGLFILCVPPGAVRAQSAGMNAHAGHGVPRVPREILERPVPLREGIGNFHDPVTTTSQEAQAYYNQGIAYLMSYVWIEAAPSFHQALRHDPNLAMAYDGLSDAYLELGDPESAHEACDKANALSAHISERERRRIAVRTAQLAYLDDNRNSQKYFAYEKAIEDAIAADPTDPVLWLLRGFADEGSPHGHGQGGGVLSIAIYEAALARSPENFATHHFLAHTFENIGRYHDALPHAEAYVRLAPAIPHAHHMLGHILRGLGLPQDALQQFLKADELEEAYYRVEQIPPAWDWHHAHNLGLLGQSYEYLGEMKAAEPVIKRAFALPAFVDFAEYNRRDWPEFLLNRGRAQEALEAALSMAQDQLPTGRAMGHALAGRALLALGRPDDANQELALADREIQLVLNPVPVQPYIDGLRGQLALRKQNFSEANARLEKAEEAMKEISGPDAQTETLFWLDSLAREARQAGDWKLAEYSARQMLAHDPTYAGSHYALALAAEHRGDTATAQREFAEARRLWSHADADLPELAVLRRNSARQP